MNSSYKLSLGIILSLSILTGGCKKDFVNSVVPSNAATADEVFSTTGAVRSYFNGIYRQMRSQWTSIDGTVGGTTDTWGYNSINLARDVKGKDIVMPYSGFYYFDYQNDNREPTYRRTRFVWYFFYELINQVNTLLKGTENSKTISGDDKTLIAAEARALRAYLYFELAREFQFTYLKDPDAPGVPVYTEPATLEDHTGKPRGTLRQVYGQINDDIEYAVQYIGPQRNLKSQINSNVAWGMAARIYLEQGRWADAANAAIEARKGLSLDAAGYTSNYNGLTSEEVIWGFPQTEEGNGQSLYYGTPSSFFEQTGEGYDAFWISVDLVNYFSPTDVRNTFYIYGGSSSDPDFLATNKFGTAEKAQYTVDLLNGQTVPLKAVDFKESLNMMRVGEMYLIEAEAKARLGAADAPDVLYALQRNRDPDALPSGNTGQNLINEILVERRKELYGELGIDWLDAKRLQLPIDRSGSNHRPPNNYVIPANDPVFNLKIPQTEIQANPNIGAGDQNP